jgi:hypothetical protein
MVEHSLNHLPNGFQEPNAMVVSTSLWNEDNYDPKELARDNAVGPGCLNQMGKELPIILIARSSLAIGVFLPLYALEPVFYMLSAHSGSTHHLAI